MLRHSPCVIKSYLVTLSVAKRRCRNKERGGVFRLPGLQSHQVQSKVGGKTCTKWVSTSAKPNGIPKDGPCVKAAWEAAAAPEVGVGQGP